MNYIISNGETSSGIILNSNESMAVLDGGVASTTTVNQYGSMTVFSGGTAIETTVDRGQFTVSSGGTAGITAVNSRGLRSYRPAARQTTPRCPAGLWACWKADTRATSSFSAFFHVFYFLYLFFRARKFI